MAGSAVKPFQFLGVIAGFVLCSALAGAQSTPSRPVRVLVPAPPGGPSDTAVRLILPRLSDGLRQPLVVTHQIGKQNVTAKVEGGGLAGQAGAVRLGIARALVTLDPALKAPLRSAGLLTRDPREKERKKYGQKGARKRFQWTKR